MDLNREPRKIAYTAAEEIRQLNHISGHVESFLGEAGIGSVPGNVSATVEGLHMLMERLPQTLRQVSRVLQQLEEKQTIRMDDGSDPATAVSHALRTLLNAQEGVTVAQQALQEAASTMSHMGGHFVDEDELADDPA